MSTSAGRLKRFIFKENRRRFCEPRQMRFPVQSYRLPAALRMAAMLPLQMTQ
jgi:hypothetical protein